MNWVNPGSGCDIMAVSAADFVIVINNRYHTALSDAVRSGLTIHPTAEVSEQVNRKCHRRNTAV